MRLAIGGTYNTSILTRELNEQEIAGLLAALDGAGFVATDWKTNAMEFTNSPIVEIKFINSGDPLCPQLTLRDHTREALAAANKGE